MASANTNTSPAEVAQYVVVSGKPAGEVYHRAKFWTRTIEDAQACERALDAEVEAGGGSMIGTFYGEWLWGPHIHNAKGLLDEETEEWTG